jgi:DNA invertase Pin-like site-specific DNA recombinase
MTRLRCAIYTRKSTEDGLEQAFNSLDAQREACEAYVKSQAHEGWNCLSDRYDDGGFSGGSMNRPGLQALLGDIDAGRIDVVVVYKVDRLTRSLLDFAHIVQRLEDKGVSFVSVTQSFNTTSSMGRLTLNVLLSFAQFEREVTGERIRDKIAASKKKGIWMGGPVPLGYDLKDRKLYVNETEAQSVRWLYDTYLKLGNVRELKQAADNAGLTSKRYTQRNGRIVGGHPFSRGQLYCLLKNPLYAGKIRHRDKVYDGQQEAIIYQEAWDKVQDLMKANGGTRNAEANTPSPSWLSGILYDDTGERMIATHSRKAGRIYRYYISAPLMAKKPDPRKGWRLPAREIEAIVNGGITDLLKNPVRVGEVLGVDRMTANVMNALSEGCDRLVKSIEGARRTKAPEKLKALLRPVIQCVDLSVYEVGMTVDPAKLNQCLGGIPGTIAKVQSSELEGNNELPHHITVPVQLKRRGVEMRMVVPGKTQEIKESDQELQKLIARAHCWFEDLRVGKAKSVSAIAKAEDLPLSEVSRTLPLAFLAPDIVADILEGKHPVDLTVQKLKRLPNLPLVWQEQRRVLGFV